MGPKEQPLFGFIGRYHTALFVFLRVGLGALKGLGELEGLGGLVGTKVVFNSSVRYSRLILLRAGPEVLAEMPGVREINVVLLLIFIIT